MISNETQLKRALSHYTLDETKNAAILSAVRRGITKQPEHLRIALKELTKAKNFGEASTFASELGDSTLSKELMEKQYEANVKSVLSIAAKERSFEETLSQIEDPTAREHAIISAVRNGITHKLHHVKLAIEELEKIGPGVFAESERIARKVGANSSDICEKEGWLGLAAYLSEREGPKERTESLYTRYIVQLTKQGKFGLAAEISLTKLGDIEWAIANGKKAGSWELVSEWLRSIGNIEESKAYSKLASMLR